MPFLPTDIPVCFVRVRVTTDGSRNWVEATVYLICAFAREDVEHVNSTYSWRREERTQENPRLEAPPGPGMGLVILYLSTVPGSYQMLELKVWGMYQWENKRKRE